MKNILNTKTDGTPALLSNVDESGNSLFVNGTEISSSSWVGEGTYTFTAGTHTYTISKAPDNDGNYQLLKVSDYTYQFVKIVSKSIREEIEDIETALSALDTKVGTAALTTTAQDCSGAINELNQRMQINSVDYKFAIDSIIFNVMVADGKTYNTYNGRKFSDYAVLIMVPGSENNNSRNSVICYAGKFCQPGGRMIATILHDAGLSSKSAIGITYISDTSYKVALDGAKVIKNLTVLGLMKKV